MANSHIEESRPLPLAEPPYCINNNIKDNDNDNNKDNDNDNDNDNNNNNINNSRRKQKSKQYNQETSLIPHSGQMTGHARDLNTSGDHFWSLSRFITQVKCPRSFSANWAISVLSPLILPLQTFF